MSGKFLTQLRFRFKGIRPTRALIENMGRYWLETGKTPPGVTIEPIAWTKTPPADLRAHLKERGVQFATPGIVKRYGEPCLTLCDYDDDDPVTMATITRVAHIIGAKPEWVEYDRTNRGWHVVICWDRTFKPAEITALQAILGSDPWREMYNLSRVLSGKTRSRRWNLLFEEKLL